MPIRGSRPKPFALTVKDAGEVLGVSRSSIYRLLDAGLLDGKKAHFGKSGPNDITLITYASVEAYFRSLPDFKMKKGAGVPSDLRLRAVK